MMKQGPSGGEGTAQGQGWAATSRPSGSVGEKGAKEEKRQAGISEQAPCSEVTVPVGVWVLKRISVQQSWVAAPALVSKSRKGILGRG